jgi:hypothetical protein
MSSKNSGGVKATTSGEKMEARTRSLIEEEFARLGFGKKQLPDEFSSPVKFSSAAYYESAEKLEILVLRGKDFHKYLRLNGFTQGIDDKTKKLFPDLILINLQMHRFIVLEIKNQNGAGSVDEKLQTTHYKQFYYSQFAKKLNFDFKLYWFLGGKYINSNKERYASIFEYMQSLDAEIFVFDGDPRTSVEALVHNLIS